MPFRIILRMDSPAEDSSTDASSDTHTDVEELMDTFYEAVKAIDPQIRSIERKIGRIETKARAATEKEVSPLDEPMNPASAAVKEWCVSKGIGRHPTLRTWWAAILKSAMVCDLETRTLRFHPDDARVWSNGSPSVGIFDLLRGVETWFSVSL